MLEGQGEEVDCMPHRGLLHLRNITIQRDLLPMITMPRTTTSFQHLISH